MISQTSAMAALRDATRHIHQELENHLPIALPDAGRGEYISHIASLWGWMGGFEEQLWAADWPEQMHAAQRGNKSLWILEDLHAAGWDAATIARLPLSEFCPDLSSQEARFGTAYVIEGAQLGGQILKKKLGPHLAPWSPRWLEGYGPDTGGNWRAFIDCAERCLDSEAACRIASEAARTSFESLAAWFKMRNKR